MKASIKRWGKGILVLLLAFSLLACQQVIARNGGSRYPDKEHLPVDYADMAFSGFDETVLQDALAELESLNASGDLQRGDVQTRERVEALYREIKSELDILSTQISLIGIEYDSNGAEEQLAEISAELSARSSLLYDQCYQVLSLLANTPCQDIIAADAGEDKMESLRNYEAVPDRMFELYQEEKELIQTYDQLMSQSPRTTVEDQYRSAGEIFCELVRVRSMIAQEAGYDNYVDYAYREIYNRDYTLEDIQLVWEAVKENIVPMEELAVSGINSHKFRGLHRQARSSGEEILDAIQPYMRQIDPELGAVFDFMREHHLYDIEYSDSKLPMGYTVGLPAYGTAFIFNLPYGDYQDYIDTIHEFGHFNETFHCTQHDLWADFNIDVGEIHSQGLTMLFTEYSDELFGEYGEVFNRIMLWDMLATVESGCLYDEFQAAVYQSPDMSLEEINLLYQQVAEQYGYWYEREECYDWVEVSHNFQNPLYYISYATSALSSLDLWLLSLKDRDEAVDIYLDLTALSLSLPYRQAMEEVGLRDIFRPETIPEMAEELERCLESGKGL